jgi:hypothetical protein
MNARTFDRTRRAAAVDRTSRWDLIEAIGEDAVDAGLPITGFESQTQAGKACSEAGLELAASTVQHLTVMAKFVIESTSRQRQLWRRYGWTNVILFAKAGYTQEAAFEFLKGEHKSRRDIEAHLMVRTIKLPPVVTLDERWATWGNDYLRLMMTGAELALLSERMELGSASALVAAMYHRLADRGLDAELQQLLAAEEAAGDAR